MDLAALLSSILGVSIDLPRFLLVFARVSSLFVIAPVLGNANVPVRFRLGLALMISFFLLPATAPVSLPDPGSLLLAVLREMTVGLLIGFLAQLIFYAVQIAGHMVAMQMGFGIERMLDPNSHTQVTGIGQIYLFVAMLTFLAADGHHLLIMSLARSFHQVPLGTFALGGLQLERMLAATNGMFVVAFGLMLPPLGVLLLIEISLAIASRVMPQLNAFVFGFPVKIMVGAATLMATIPLLSDHFEGLINGMAGQILRFFT
ncbi:MAG TPA: flagellar biosynthetic protein FliR [Chroococcales cyanobacterium]|jgi:flagellar biosynthetic protein FliR